MTLVFIRQIRRNSWNGDWPTLLIRSTAPRSASTRSRQSLTPDVVPMSAAKPRIRPGPPRTSDSSSARRRPRGRRPRHLGILAGQLRAMAAPNPRLGPVTTASRPLRSLSTGEKAVPRGPDSTVARICYASAIVA